MSVRIFVGKKIGHFLPTFFLPMRYTGLMPGYFRTEGISIRAYWVIYIT